MTTIPYHIMQLALFGLQRGREGKKQGGVEVVVGGDVRPGLHTLWRGCSVDRWWLTTMSLSTDCFSETLWPLLISQGYFFFFTHACILLFWNGAETSGLILSWLTAHCMFWCRHTFYFSLDQAGLLNISDSWSQSKENLKSFYVLKGI